MKEAANLGYNVDEFWLLDPLLNCKKLSSIMRATSRSERAGMTTVFSGVGLICGSVLLVMLGPQLLALARRQGRTPGRTKGSGQQA